MQMKPRIRLGEMLVRAGVITQEQLEEALESQKKSSNAKIGEILVRLGYTTEDKIFFHLARQLDIPYMSLRAQSIDAEVLNLIPGEMARKFNIIPIDKIGKFITIAMSNPLDDEACVEVGKITGLKVQKLTSSKKDIGEIIERYYPISDSVTLTEDNQPSEEVDSEIKLEETEDVLPQEEPEEQSEVESTEAQEEPEEQSEVESTKAQEKPEEQSAVESTKGSTSYSRLRSPSLLTPASAHPFFRRKGEAAIVDELFVPEYTFDNFIPDSDAEAFRAAIHLCNIEQVLYNPLLISAESGLGKTHLLHAIGNNIIQNVPQKNIEYISCRELSFRMMDADIYEVCAQLCQNWCLLDILLFDDFQALLAEKSNQQVFIFIFDFLYHIKKQMVIASCPLDTRDYEIEVGLLSRIGAGLTVKIIPPNFENRLAILHKWEEIEDNSQLSDTDLNSIAEQTYEDVRQLLAARNRLRFQKLQL